MHLVRAPNKIPSTQHGVVVVSEYDNFKNIFKLTMLEQYAQNVLYLNESACRNFFIEYNSYIVILDCALHNANHSELIINLANFQSTLAITASSPSATISTAVSAMRAGAIEYLAWPFSEFELELAVRYADALLADRALTNEKAAMRARFGLLSPREKVVVGSIVAGKQNKIIANDLGLSVRTVEMYRANLMKKLGTKSVSDVVRAYFLQSQISDNYKS